MKLTFALTTALTAMSVVPASLQSPPATGLKMTLSGGTISSYTFIQRNVWKPPS